MIPIKTETEIAGLRRSADLLVQTFHAVETILAPGILTEELADVAEEVILSGGGKPAFKGYNGYPASICVSIESEVVHGIPRKRKIEEGKLISVDIGVELDGYYSDATKTYGIGNISDERLRLIEVTRNALYRGIQKCRKGNRISDISHEIQHYVETNGFSVVQALVGHGIGRKLHEEPQIPNFGPPRRGAKIAPGMVFAVEPMVNMGGHEVRILNDGWTIETQDGYPSAHFEHTVLVTEGTPDILTVAIDLDEQGRFNG
jgi:methionyl aminopeptidase